MEENKYKKVSAQVVLLNEEGLVLGVSRKDNHDDFGLVGGRMESIDNNDPKATAIRECKEETGLDIVDLELVFAIHKGGNMGYTYLAKYTGEINHNEPHVVKWVSFNKLIEGSFGKYNKLVSESLDDLGVKYIKYPIPTEEYIFGILNDEFHDYPIISVSSRKYWEKYNCVPDLHEDDKQSEDINNLCWNYNISLGECDETSFDVSKDGELLVTNEEVILAMVSAGFIYDKKFEEEIN